MAGIGYLKVAPELLDRVVAILPNTYRIVGSKNSEGPVELAIWSSEFAYDGIEMQCIVNDAGSTRTIKLSPTGAGLRAVA